MAKVLFIYYSLDGNTAYVADLLPKSGKVDV